MADSKIPNPASNGSDIITAAQTPPFVVDRPAPTVLRSAAMMSVATLMSRILGMIRDMAMAALFPRMVSDAFVVAFRLPNLFRRILGEGSLAASFVPLYVESLNEDRHHNSGGKGHHPRGHVHVGRAPQFAGAVFSMLVVLTSVLSVLGIIYMHWIMAHLVGGEGYMQVPGKYELTVLFARIMFGYLFLVTTYAFLMSMANAHKVFFLPALAPAGFNLILVVTAFTPHWQAIGDQLAWGVILGGVLQLVMTVYPLWQRGVVPKFTWYWSGPRVVKFFKIVLPSMLGMSVAQLLGVLNVNFASRLPQGTHSYIYLADRLLEFPQSLLSVSLGVALLPTLADLWVRGEKNKFLQVTQRHVRLLMVLSLPCAVGLYVLAEPIVRVLYGRGQFMESDIMATAQVLSVYAFILAATGFHRVTVPAFYAVKNTWLPATNSAFCLVVHYFVAGWATEHYGLMGLVGATAFTGALNLVILLISFRLLFGELGFVPFVRSFLWLMPALLAMGFAAPWVYGLIRPLMGTLIALAASILIAVIIYGGVSFVSGHPDAREVLQLLRRRRRRKT